MYYKIINQECDVYKKLRKQREAEIQAEKANKKLIEEVVDFKWTKYYGHAGQQNFYRVTEYKGFAPLNEDEVDTKKWRKAKNMKGAYVPNLRSKSGREVQERINKEFQAFRFWKIWDILGLEDIGKFAFPFVEIAKDTIIIFLDEKQEPKDPNVVEITKKEFEELLKKTK